jgi:3-oxoacyl-[acyl-carrier protein] reductase
VSRRADIAIVTGASGGIGAAVSRALHARGQGRLRLALHCHSRPDAAEALSRELDGSFVVRANLATASGREGLLSAALAQGSPFILVNNAGVDRPHEPALDIDEASFDRMVELNLKAPVFLMKAFGREMARAGSGVIVNVSSVLARVAVTGSAVYRLTKAALEEATRQFAMELGPRGVRVNAVAPGFIDTPMTESLPEETRERFLRQVSSGEFGRPEAVAQAVCALVENDYVNGAVLRVDGGIAL